jgi:competence protein ComEC
MTLVYLSVAWACGICLAHFLWSQGALSCASPAWPAALLAGLMAGLAIMLRGRPFARWSACLLLLLLLGVARYQAQPFAACPGPDDLAYYNNGETNATIEGVVATYPDLRDVTAQYEVRVEQLTVDGTSHVISGRLLVQAARRPAYRYGDRVRVTGQLETPPLLDDFDYRAYLAQRNIHSVIWRARVTLLAEGSGSPARAAIYRVREEGSALLNRVLPEPAAALANGILLGIESGIPADLDEAFQRTGASHIIVISGSNMALFAGLFMAILSRWVGKRRAAWPALILVGLYVLLAGDGPAAQRAGLMSGLFILATYLGRHSTAYVSLCTAGLAMTTVNPLALWDTGFRLSFLATLGMILFTQPLSRPLAALLARRLPAAALIPALDLLNAALVVTLAAQALTLPLIVAIFGRLSLISPITNFLILPVQPIIMTSGLLTLLGGFLWEPLGRVLAVVPWLFLSYTTAVVRWTAAAPLAAVEVGPLVRSLAVLPYAGLALYAVGRLLHDHGWQIRWSRRTAAWTLGLLAPPILLAGVLTGLPNGRLHIRYLAAGDAEAALIITPTGQRVWVWDDRGDGAELARLAGRRVDVAVGPNAAALWPDAQPVTPEDLPAGGLIRLADGVMLARLNAGDAWVLRLTYGDFSTLLPAGLTQDAQAALVQQHSPAEVRATVLKTPIAGSGAWPGVEFLALAAPQTILWPEGTTYPPNADAWLTAHGAVRVPGEGVVEVITDGTRYWVE